MIEICSECSYPKEVSGYDLCFICWKAQQGFETGIGDKRYADLQKELLRLFETYLEREESWSYQVEELRGLKVGSLDKELLKRLLKFCHPDKNPERLEEAGELTRILLGLRD